MATITVTVPDVLSLGRNGQIGTLPVDWSRVPQLVLDHVAGVYYAQYITDAANSGGRDVPMAERFALAEKKLAQMYAGEIRRAGKSAEPADPIDKLVYNRAKESLAIKIRKQPDFAAIKSGKGIDRINVWCENHGADMGDLIAELIGKNPTWYNEAAREYAASETAADEMMAGLAKKK